MTLWSELSGANRFQRLKAHAYVRDTDLLDREEMEFAQSLRAFVDRKAPTPIGVKFHPATSTTTTRPFAGDIHTSSMPGSDVGVSNLTQRIANHRNSRMSESPISLPQRHSRSVSIHQEMNEERHMDEDDMEEDEEDEEDEDEEDDSLLASDQDEPEGQEGDDSFDVSMEMDSTTRRQW